MKPVPESTGAIWNPSAAGWWSLIFTPIFGIYIHKLNWETLNESQRANSTKIWLYIGLIILATNFLAVNLFGLSGLVTLYLIIWYFTDGESQIKYVEEKFGGHYLHKSWKNPILIMSSVYFAFIGISFYLFIYEFYNFTISDKVRHALYYANDAQLAFADYFQQYHKFPNNLVEAGFTLKSPSESIKDINLHKEDKIVVLSITMAIKPIEDKKLFLTLIADEKNNIVLDKEKNIQWECQGPEIPNEYLPQNCRSAVSVNTTLAFLKFIYRGFTASFFDQLMLYMEIKAWLKN